MPDRNQERELLEERAKCVADARTAKEESLEEHDRVTYEASQKIERLLDRADEIEGEVEEIRRERGIDERLEDYDEVLDAREERIAKNRDIQPSGRLDEMDVDEIDRRERRAFIHRIVPGLHVRPEDRPFLYGVSRHNVDLPRVSGDFEPETRDEARNYTYNRRQVRRAYDAYRNRQRQRVMEFRSSAQQSVGTSGEGGVLVPEGFRRQLVEARKMPGSVRNVATEIETPSGNDLPIPTVDDTAKLGEYVAEASTGSSVAASDVDFSNVTLGANKLQSGPIKFSLELQQDSFMDIESFLARAMGQRFARAEGRKFTTGSTATATTPHGIITATSGSSATFAKGSSNLSFSVLKDAISAVDPAYQEGPGVGWMFNDGIKRAIWDIQDSQNRPLWEANTQVGAPDRLLGFPVTVNQRMPGAGTSDQFPLLFGDLSAYWIRDVMGMSVFPLREKFINEGNFAVLAFARNDGKPVVAASNASERPYRGVRTT